MEVRVTVSPEPFEGSFIEGKNITLTCTGTNPPNVTRGLNFWWVGPSGSNITAAEPDRIAVTRTANSSMLSIMNIPDVVEIEGLYMCHVFNRIYQDSVTVTTEINVICEICLCVFRQPVR